MEVITELSSNENLYHQEIINFGIESSYTKFNSMETYKDTKGWTLIRIENNFKLLNKIQLIFSNFI